MSPADTTFEVNGQPLRVSLASYRGRLTVDVRFWFLPCDGGNLRPGKRGVSIAAHAVPEVIAALQRLQAQMVRDGYLSVDADTGLVRLRPDVYPTEF